MPAPDAGHGGTRLKPTPSPRFTQPDPPAPPQSRRKSTPPVSRLPRSSRSTRPRNDRQPPCRRQIPIDRTGRTTEPDPPAVSSPEACPTPADRGKAPHPPVSGRRPTTLNTSGSPAPSPFTSAVGGKADAIGRKAGPEPRASVSVQAPCTAYRCRSRGPS